MDWWCFIMAVCMDDATEYRPTERNEVLISANPRAGARSGSGAVQELEQALEQRDYQVEAVHDLDLLRERADAGVSEGRLRAVVAAGGDGTAAVVVNSIPVGVPLAILPLGTENLLAKYLQIPPDPERVADLICAGRTVPLDAGRANGRIFLLMVGCGFDAEVVRRLHAAREGHISHLDYAKPIIDSIRNYEYPPLRVYCDAQAVAGNPTTTDFPQQNQPIDAHFAFVINLPRYAGGLSFAPDAVGTDGRLDVCTFQEGSFWSGLRYLTGVVLGQHESWDECKTARATRVRIESDGEVPFQLDGDPGGNLPVEIEVLPGRLRMVVGEEWVAKEGG